MEVIGEILWGLKSFPVVVIAKDYLESSPEFKSGYDRASLESLMLTLSGHSPIKDYRFDESKLKKWCDENSLNYLIDERERVVKFKTKNT